MLRRSHRVTAPVFAEQVVRGAVSAIGCVVDVSFLSPFGLCVGVGFLLRCMTMPLSIWGDQHVGKLARAMPELVAAHESYVALHDHPFSGYWHKQLATKKLEGERERILARTGTSTLWYNLPPVVAGAASLSLLLTAATAPQLLLLGQGWVVASPLALGSVAGVAAVDAAPALPLALALLNVRASAHRRLGFGNRRFEVRLYQITATVNALCVALAIAAALGLAVPVHATPVALGMALAGCLRTVVVAHPFGRHLCGIPELPASHGTYGEQSTYVGHKMVLEVRKLREDKDMAKQWATTKAIVDLECDMRIFRMFESMGLINDDHQLAEERRWLEERRRALRGAGADDGADQQLVGEKAS
jgi:hypothetical protein